MTEVEQKAKENLAVVLNRPPYHNAIVAAIRHFNGARELGAASSVLSKYYPGGITESQALKFLNMTILREHIQCAVAPDGTAEAFIVWGWISERTIEAKVFPPAIQLHHLAANEGSHLCLLLSVGKPEAVVQLVKCWFEDVVLPEREFYVYPGIVDGGKMERFEAANKTELIRRLVFTKQRSK